MQFQVSKYLLLIVFFSLTYIAACSEANQSQEYVATEQKFEVGDTLEVSGILIDTHCYAFDKDNIGHDHMLPETGFREDCAEYCALQGYPVAVLDRVEGQEDEVWAIMTASQIFADYMTQTVRIKGTFRSNGVIDPLDVELSDGDGDWIRIM